MDLKNIFGQRVKELRTTNKMTQLQLGEQIGLSKQAINDIEHGRRETTITKAILLARFFNTTVEYLFGDTNNPLRSENKSFIEELFGMEELFSFSKRLKELRTQKGLSVQEVGKDTCFGTLRYKNMENAETNPPLSWLVILSDYFDVSLDYLVGRSDDPKRY